jgi:hypothetical protein
MDFMDFWVNHRRAHYKFQVEPEVLERWEKEQATIIKRRVAAVLMVVASIAIIETVKPMVADTSSFGPVLLRAGAVLGLGFVGLCAFLLWRNPFRAITSGGNPGDCMVRGD